MAENPRIEELRRRVQLDPASIAFAALAEEFRRMGRHEEAIDTCRAGLQRHPAYLSARVTLGRALIETGDYDAAREELETVLRSAPENLAAIRGLAQIHERLGQSTEMDPHLAAMMNAEVERVALAAATAPPPAPVEAAAVPSPPPPESAAAPIAAEPVAEESLAQPALAQEALAQEPAAQAPIAVAAAPAATESSPADEALVSEPIAIAAAAMVLDRIPVSLAPPRFEETPVFEPEVEEADLSPPDPAMLATLARLERFLVAIDAARHP